MFSRPLVCLTISFAFGIALPALADVPPGIFYPAAAACIFAAAAVFFALRKNVFPLLTLVFFLLGAAAGSAAGPGREVFPDHFPDRLVTINGYICGEPDVRGDRTAYMIRVMAVDPAFPLIEGDRVLLFIQGRREDLGYGDAVRFRGVPYLPQTPGNPGQFDYREYISGRGIKALISVKDAGGVEKTGKGMGSTVARAALNIKQRLMQVIRDTMDPRHAALVNGIVFGSRGEIDRRTGEIFNEAGVVHILSVSGLHVGLVAAGLLGLMGMLGLQRFSFPALTAVLAVYAFITGMGPAVVRAALMAWFYFLGCSIGRDRDWATTLSASALIILVFSPRSLFDPGFQLSFAATWGILHLGPAIDRWLESRGIERPWVRGCLAVPLAAQAGTLPLVAYYFNIYSLVSIPANLLAVPLVGVILPLGLAASLAGLIFIKAALLINYATAALLDLMLIIVGLMRSIPGSVIYAAPPHPAAVAGWYLSLLMAAGGAGLGKLYAGILRTVATVIMAAALTVSVYFAWGEKGALQVHFIDVGQGDSILVRFPNGRSMLVDAGGWKDEFSEGWGAGQVVASYLRRTGTASLDALVLTHPHEDHAAGAGFLIGRFDVGAVLVPPAEYGDQRGEQADPGYERLLARAEKANIPVRELFRGDLITLDPLVRVEVAAPGPDLLRGTRSDLNNNSVVISIRYGGTSLLLTGDIELEGQARLIEAAYDLKHSVLKVPHHGSRYLLPDFIRRVGPEISVVSVGRNSFGQPDPGTLALAGSEGGKLFRTDRHGLVVLTSDGKEIKVKTFK